MPVSSPSYFPPQKSIDRIVGLNAGVNQLGNRVFLAGQSTGANSNVSDLVAIGNNVLSAGITDADATGTVAIGSQALSAATAYNASDPGDVVIGYRACNALVASGANVVIGAQAVEILTQASGFEFERSVVIGAQAYQNCQSTASQGQGNNVVVGYQAARGGGTPNTFVGINSTIIGGAACSGCDGSVSNQTIIGANAGIAIVSPNAANVIIGASAAQTLTSGGSNAIVGFQVSLPGAASENAILGHSTAVGTAALRNVVIGMESNAGTGAATDNVAIGYRAQWGGTTPVGNIAIGANAASGIATPASHICAIGTLLSATRRGCLYSDMNAGNVIIGNSTPGTNRDFAGNGATQIVKLLNGTMGDTNPVGGGYFYVTAGALHWVGSSGTDTALAPA